MIVPRRDFRNGFYGVGVTKREFRMEIYDLKFTKRNLRNEIYKLKFTKRGAICGMTFSLLPKGTSSPPIFGDVLVFLRKYCTLHSEE